MPLPAHRERVPTRLCCAPKQAQGGTRRALRRASWGGAARTPTACYRPSGKNRSAAANAAPNEDGSQCASDRSRPGDGPDAAHDVLDVVALDELENRINALQDELDVVRAEARRTFDSSSATPEAGRRGRGYKTWSRSRAGRSAGPREQGSTRHASVQVARSCQKAGQVSRVQHHARRRHQLAAQRAQGRCSIRRIGRSRTHVTLERWACLMLSGSLSSRAGERALGATLEEARARAEAQRFREDAAAQREARTKAEIEAQAQAVDDKTARLRSLRLAKEAAEHRA